MDGMGSAAAANRLLRNQLRDVAGQLLTLTERMCLLTQDIGGTDRTVYSGRGDTLRGMPTAGLPTFREAVDMATWVERELADARAQREHPRPYRGQRRPHPYPEEGPSQGGRTTKRPKTEQEISCAPTREPEPWGKPCIICGRAHQVTGCPWRYNHCFRCGKPGHFRASCPQRPATTLTAPRREERGTTAATAPQEDLPDGQLKADHDDSGSLPRRVVRRWPKGCGRVPRADPIEDAMSRKG